MPTAILSGVSAPVAIDGSLAPGTPTDVELWNGLTYLGASRAVYGSPRTFTGTDGLTWTLGVNGAFGGGPPFVATSFQVTAPAGATGLTGYTARVGGTGWTTNYSASFRVVAVGGNSVMMF